MTVNVFLKVAQQAGVPSARLTALAAQYDPAVHKPAGGPASCPICQGAQWLRSDWPVGHPRFGQFDPCPACNAAAKFNRGRHGIYNVDYDLTFDGLQRFPGSNAPQIGQEIKAILERGWGGVYLWSQGFGNAKTELLKIAVAEWVRMGNDGRFALFADLVDEMREAFGNDQPQPGADQWDRSSAYQRLQMMQAIPLLAIDELEEVSLTTYTTNTRFRLFNERYERTTRMYSGITLIASNVPPGSLPPKLQSRFSDPDFMVTREVTGKDVRPAMAEFRAHPTGGGVK